MRARVWNARAALLYSVGGWTTLGALMYYSSKDDGGGGSGHESDPQAKQEPRREVYTTEALGFKVTNVVTYRETQPPLTRLLRRVKSFFDPDEPPSEN